jgi:hypothetical protein
MHECRHTSARIHTLQVFSPHNYRRHVCMNGTLTRFTAAFVRTKHVSCADVNPQATHLYSPNPVAIRVCSVPRNADSATHDGACHPSIALTHMHIQTNIRTHAQAYAHMHTHAFTRVMTTDPRPKYVGSTDVNSEAIDLNMIKWNWIRIKTCLTTMPPSFVLVHKVRTWESPALSVTFLAVLMRLIMCVQFWQVMCVYVHACTCMYACV